MMGGFSNPFAHCCGGDEVDLGDLDLEPEMVPSTQLPELICPENWEILQWRSSVVNMRFLISEALLDCLLKNRFRTFLTGNHLSLEYFN